MLLQSIDYVYPFYAFKKLTCSLNRCQVDCVKDGLTPLHEAVSAGQTKQTQALIIAGADTGSCSVVFFRRKS